MQPICYPLCVCVSGFLIICFVADTGLNLIQSTIQLNFTCWYPNNIFPSLHDLHVKYEDLQMESCPPRLEYYLNMHCDFESAVQKTFRKHHSSRVILGCGRAKFEFPLSHKSLLGKFVPHRHNDSLWGAPSP